MTISAIVAKAINNVIGFGNQIPWYLPADLKHFKSVTLNHHVIMGRKTFESIGKPLPKRTNIIITRDVYFVASGCVVTHSLEEALEISKRNSETEAFIIGGAEIYEMSMPYLDKLYLTEVDCQCEGDKFFPEILEEEWIEINAIQNLKDDRNKYDYKFRELRKLKRENESH